MVKRRNREEITKIVRSENILVYGINGSIGSSNIELSLDKPHNNGISTCWTIFFPIHNNGKEIFQKSIKIMKME